MIKRPKTMSLSFPSGSFQLGQLASSVVIITGAGRSGKTLVGNLLGSCQHVEHIDEPWLPLVLPMLAGLGSIDENLAVQMFQTSVTELLNNRILMRDANLRPSDMSSIWKQKSPEEIFSRLINLHSREDVKRHGRDHEPTLVLNLPDTGPYSSLFKKAIPECHIVHLLRDGIDTALEVSDKGWLSDEELSHPDNPLPYREYSLASGDRTVYLPCWVEEGTEEQYLSYSDFGRGLYYWLRMANVEEIHMAGFDESQYTMVKYQDLIDHPARTFGTLQKRLNLTETDQTALLISALTEQKSYEVPDGLPSSSDLAEVSAIRFRYQELGWPVGRVDQLLSRTKTQTEDRQLGSQGGK